MGISITDAMVADCFDQTDGTDRLHAAIVKLIDLDSDLQYVSKPYMCRLFKELPEHVQWTALRWGLYDTEFGDNLDAYLEQQGLPTFDDCPMLVARPVL